MAYNGVFNLVRSAGIWLSLLGVLGIVAAIKVWFVFAKYGRKPRLYEEPTDDPEEYEYWETLRAWEEEP